MTETNLSFQPEPDTNSQDTRAIFFNRIAKYSLKRLLELSIMLVIGMFLAVTVLNYGGYIDEIYRANIDSTIMAMAQSMTEVSGEEK